MVLRRLSRNFLSGLIKFSWKFVDGNGATVDVNFRSNLIVNSRRRDGTILTWGRSQQGYSRHLYILSIFLLRLVIMISKLLICIRKIAKTQISLRRLKYFRFLRILNNFFSTGFTWNWTKLIKKRLIKKQSLLCNLFFCSAYLRIKFSAYLPMMHLFPSALNKPMYINIEFTSRKWKIWNSLLPTPSKAIFLSAALSYAKNAFNSGAAPRGEC